MKAEVFAVYCLNLEEKLNEILKQKWLKESYDSIPELTEELQLSENFMRKRLDLKNRSSQNMWSILTW